MSPSVGGEGGAVAEAELGLGGCRIVWQKMCQLYRKVSRMFGQSELWKGQMR
jgi:hypothetical protein